MFLAYHGTDKKSAKSILKKGFQKGTYFTDCMDSAICMGGAWLFVVLFAGEKPDSWQWRTDFITSDKIVSLRKIKIKLIKYNVNLFREYCNSNKKSVCNNCNGYGETTYKDDGHHLLPGGSSWKKRKEIKVCSVCNGYGEQPAEAGKEE